VHQQHCRTMDNPEDDQQSTTQPNSLYRSSTLGLTLAQSVEDLVEEDLLDPEISEHIMSTFDSVVAKTFDESIRARMTIEGELKTYRCLENSWELQVNNATAHLDGDVEYVPELLIFACKRNPASRQKRSKK